MSDSGLGAGAAGWVRPQPAAIFFPTFFQGCCTFLVLTSLILIPIGLTNLAPKSPPLWLLLDASCLVLAPRSQIGSSAKASRGPQLRELRERERESDERPERAIRFHPSERQAHLGPE